MPIHTLPETPSHPFYTQVNRLLQAHGFDSFVEELCAPYYAKTLGRPSIAPGVYFRLLMIGYFEGLGSERAIAWRVADSISLRRSGLLLYRLHPESFESVAHTRAPAGGGAPGGLRLGAEGVGRPRPAQGQDGGGGRHHVGSQRRDAQHRAPGHGPNLLRVSGLARAEGIETPTKQDLARRDKKRANKASNKDWEHPHDADARIAKMKDGRTHLAHKAEHTVDADTQALVAVQVCGADAGDTESLNESLAQAGGNLKQVPVDEQTALGEVVADKGYHSNGTMKTLKEAKIRSYVSEPDRGRRNWKNDAPAKAAVYANRRRIRGERGKRLQKRRAKYAERSFAHAYETGGLRRTHLRGHTNIYKRLCIHGGASISDCCCASSSEGERRGGFIGWRRFSGPARIV